MSAFLLQLIHTGIYKRNQGRITRQVTFAALALIVALGAWRLTQVLASWPTGAQYGLQYALSGILLGAGMWVAYRVVNLPQFADFLIAVEAEMNKVSWPTRGELFRASLVVLIMIFALAGILALFDLIWGWLFSKVLY